MDLLLDVSFDISLVQDASRHSGLDDLDNEIVVADSLLALHDAHNCSLCFVVAVGSYALMRLLVLFLCLLQLDLVDFDPHLGVVEGRRKREGIGLVDFAALGMLAEDLVFGTGE